MSNGNSSSNNGSKNRNTTTQKKKRSAAAQARRSAKWQAHKEAKRATALAKQATRRAEKEAKVKTVLEMFPNVMGIVGAQGFLPNIGKVKGTSKQIRTALNTVPLFQNAQRSTIYPSGITLLNHYLENQQWDKAMEVLNQGVPKKILENPVRSIPPMSPLVYVYEWGQIDLFRKLLEKGANPNTEIVNGSQHIPLLTFIVDRFAENSNTYVELLLDHRADINKKDSHERLPIEYAIRRRKYDTVQLLINRGAALETPNERGYTAVLSAIAISDKRALALMVAKGIDINKETGPNKLTPLKIAVINGNKDILQDVIALNPRLDAKDNLGNTALHYATMINALEKIALLKTAGANPRLTNKEGVSPINIADGLRDGGDSRAYNLLKE